MIPAAITSAPGTHTVITEPFGPDNAHGDQTWAHEDWHAATDYPHPQEEPAR